MGLEKMRKHNRMMAKGENTTHMHMRQSQTYHTNQFKTMAYNRFNYRYKSALTILYTWGNSTTDMVVD